MEDDGGGGMIDFCFPGRLGFALPEEQCGENRIRRHLFVYGIIWFDARPRLKWEFSRD